MTKRRVAVLASGRGSNLAALIEAARDPAYPAEIVLVITNRPAAGALDRARAAGIAAVGLDHKDFANRDAFDAEMQKHLDAHGIDLICLAGYMRLLSDGFVNHWNGRMLNIHPSLLPLFKGLHTHERALAAGVKLHGATVHFVRPELDDGPIVAQGAINIRDEDTPDSLAARVLADVEHQIYPEALRLVAGGLVEIDGDLVRPATPTSGAATGKLIAVTS